MPDSPDQTDQTDPPLELAEDSVAAIAAVAEGPRAWVMDQIEHTDFVREMADQQDAIRRRVELLLEAVEFFEELREIRTPAEMDSFVFQKMRAPLPFVFKRTDYTSFPHYKQIVSDAIMGCLLQIEDEDRWGRVCIRNAIALKIELGKGITFNDSEIPGYTDAWKTAFVHAMEHGDQDWAIRVAEVTHGEVNLREIPNYNELVRGRYYRLTMHCHGREDETLRDALGEGVDFSDEEEQVVAEMSKCLGDINNHNVITIEYLANKFGEVHFGPENIPHFEEGVKAAFLFCLEHGNLSVSSAKVLKRKLGDGIDFSDEVRAGIAYNFDQIPEQDQQSEYDIQRALKIKKELGDGVDLSADPDCERAVVNGCMKLLKRGLFRISYIASIKEKLGVGMGFSEQTVKGYNAAVQKALVDTMREGRVGAAVRVQEHFGEGVPLDPASVEGYGEALREGFSDLLSHSSYERAGSLVDHFETKGAEIKDKTAIIQGQFRQFLQDYQWRKALELKQAFEPGVPCDRAHITGYDEAFCACLGRALRRISGSNTDEADRLYGKLGEGIDITDVLRKLADENEDKFIAFARKEHWKAVLGDDVIDRFLAALPAGTDEKRNAFTHNAYDRTTTFLQFLWRYDMLELNAAGFAVMTDYVGRFGLSRSGKLYQCFSELSGLRGDDHRALRLFAPGIASVDDLERRVDELRRKVYSAEPFSDVGDLEEFELELLAVATGKSTHRFDGGREPIERIASDFSENHEAGEITEVPEGYRVEEAEVPMVLIDFDAEVIREDYHTLRREIVRSAENSQEALPLVKKAVLITEQRLRILESKPANKFLLEQISQLKALRGRIETAESLDDLMVVLMGTRFLGKKNPFHPVMREIVFRKIFIKNRSEEALEDMKRRLDREDVLAGNVLEIISTVDDTVKQHVLNLERENEEQYWSPKAWDVLHASRKDTSLVDVLKIFSPHIGNLRQAAGEFKLEETGESATVRAIPDRGFVGEMSGYLADVCYTAEYPLLKDRPNLIPHKLVKGEGDAVEFFGSYLIFELEESTGEKVMLVRGFNVPDEASIDIVKFIEMNLDRLEATARRRGMTKVVIPGNMGALTNYPLTKKYLYNRYILGRDPIELSERFNFNGYDLTEDCFVVRELDQPESRKRPRALGTAQPYEEPPAAAT